MNEVAARIRGAVHAAVGHDSAVAHVTGAARYLDDVPVVPGTLEAALVLSPHAHARIRRVDLSAARAAPGVIAAITAADIPGKNDIAPIRSDEPALAADVVEYDGQPVAAIAAMTLDQARAAAKLAAIDYDQVTDATLHHLLGCLLEAPSWGGRDDALTHMIGDLRGVWVLAGADRVQDVALGDDPRRGRLVIEDQGCAGSLLGHLGGGLSQRVAGPDCQHHTRHPLANLHSPPSRLRHQVATASGRPTQVSAAAWQSVSAVRRKLIPRLAPARPLSADI